MFARGRNAWGVCDRCGFEFKLDRLRYQVKAGKQTKLRVCRQCMDVDAPADRPQKWVLRPEAIAVRDPRPDIGEDQARSIGAWGPVFGIEIPVFPERDVFQFPQPEPGTDPTPGFVTEDGLYLLLEDDTYLLLENS